MRRESPPTWDGASPKAAVTERGIWSRQCRDHFQHPSTRRGDRRLASARPTSNRPRVPAPHSLPVALQRRTGGDCKLRTRNRG